MTSLGVTYWCHQCNQTVRPTSRDDLICPNCNDGFLEEIDPSNATGGDFHVDHGVGFEDEDVGGGEGTRDPADSMATGFRRPQPEDMRFVNRPGQNSILQHINQYPNRSRSHPAVLQVLEAMSAVLQQIQPPQGGQEPGEVDASGDGTRGRSGGGGGEGTGQQGFNPMLMLQGQMQNFLGGGGNVEVFFDNGTGIPRRLPGNFGDYFLGPGLDQLIQQLAENDPNRYGAPPASKSAVEAMPTIQISKEHMGTDAAQCAVCKDEFEMGASVRQMPCKHMYHEECIMPWLAQHNSCPVCRYEMPTDDQDYDRSRTPGQSGTAAASSVNPATSASRNAAGSNSAAGMDGGGTSGGFTFWGSPAGFGMVPVEAMGGGGSRDTGLGGPTSGSQSSSAPAPAAAGAAPSGASFGRRFSMNLPWFRSSTPPPAPAQGPGPGPGPARGNGDGGNQSSGDRRDDGDEPHPALD